MNTLKKSLSVMLILLAVLALCMVQSFAAGDIMTDEDVSLTLSYVDADTPIANAKFSVYKVADVDAYFRVSLTPEFEAYKDSIAGLNELEAYDQAGWLELAATLKGYVLRDELTPAASGRTDSNGELDLSLKPGLYLVIGLRITTEDFNTYAATPYMVFLPGLDEVNNEWVYTVRSVPKFEKGLNPDDDACDISRKVIKTWDDSGYESIRPEEITVQLLRDGEVYDTQVLSKANNWRYKWDELDSHYEWLIVEETPECYTAKISHTGITFNITNKYVVPITGNDPPVQKRVTGDKPKTDGLFTFVLEAQDENNPMPAGSEGSKKTVQITGAGSKEFGEIIFEKPGTYVYSIYELNRGAEGYTYDRNVYCVTYVVALEGDALTCTRTITDSDDKAADKVEFTNAYKTPGRVLPQTGQLWWPVPVLLCLGLVMFTAGTAIERKRER